MKRPLIEKDFYRMFWMKVWGLSSPEISSRIGRHPQLISRNCREMGLFFPIGVYPRARLKKVQPIGRRGTNWQEIVDLGKWESEGKMWDDLYPRLSLRQIADLFLDKYKWWVSSQTVRNRLISLGRKMRSRGGPNHKGKKVKDTPRIGAIENFDKWGNFRPG